MGQEDREYTTRDRPAERGIVINNILLTIVTLGGGIFSAIMLSYMSHLTDSVLIMEKAITTIQIKDGVTINELGHINSNLAECKEIHININKRVYNLETIVYREHPSSGVLN